LRSRLQESFPESLSMSLCRLVSKLLMLWSQLEEVRESLLLEIDRLERQLLQSMLLSIRKRTIRILMKRRDFTVSTLPLDRKDQLLLILLKT
jgi:hypothetical protein